MTMKIQNARPSGNVIIDPSGKRDAENVHREFAEQKKQIHHRQRQYQFCSHDCTPFTYRFRNRGRVPVRPST